MFKCLYVVIFIYPFLRTSPRYHVHIQYHFQKCFEFSQWYSVLSNFRYSFRYDIRHFSHTFMRYQKIPAWHQCPKKSDVIKKYKDSVFMYNVHIHDKARVLGIGRNQNQKLCNLHSLIVNGTKHYHWKNDNL